MPSLTSWAAVGGASRATAGRWVWLLTGLPRGLLFTRLRGWGPPRYRAVGSDRRAGPPAGACGIERRRDHRGGDHPPAPHLDGALRSGREPARFQLSLSSIFSGPVVYS